MWRWEPKEGSQGKEIEPLVWLSDVGEVAETECKRRQNGVCHKGLWGLLVAFGLQDSATGSFPGAQPFSLKLSYLHGLTGTEL